MRSPPCHSLFPYTTLFRSLQRGIRKDALEAVGVGPFDGGAVVPPESDHVDELRVFIEKHCQLRRVFPVPGVDEGLRDVRSEEHTSELQSRGHLVCRLLLEK